MSNEQRKRTARYSVQMDEVYGRVTRQLKTLENDIAPWLDPIPMEGERWDTEDAQNWAGMLHTLKEIEAGVQRLRHLAQKLAGNE